MVEELVECDVMGFGLGQGFGNPLVAQLACFIESWNASDVLVEVLLGDGYADFVLVGFGVEPDFVFDRYPWTLGHDVTTSS